MLIPLLANIAKSTVPEKPLKELLKAEVETNNVAKLLGPYLSERTLDLGQALGVPYNKIREIQGEAFASSGSGPGMHYRCLCELVEYWRTHTNDPTWMGIALALKHMRDPEPQLMHILEDYLRKQPH